LIDVQATQHADARLDQLVEAQISVDELAESLRGDVLTRRLGLPIEARDAADDIQKLQKQSLLTAGGSGAVLPVLGTEQYSFAIRSQQLLTGPVPDGAELNAYLVVGNQLRAHVDAARADLDVARAQGTSLRDSEVRTAVTRSAAAAIAVAILVFLVGWWIRRGLLRSLFRLAGVARAVAGGDLAARTGFSASDEVGELARVLDGMAAAMQTAFSELDADAARQDFRARLDRALARARYVRSTESSIRPAWTA
jgi:methyl-accepting chemotaxis protein